MALSIDDTKCDLVAYSKELMYALLAGAADQVVTLEEV